MHIGYGAERLLPPFIGARPLTGAPRRTRRDWGGPRRPAPRSSAAQNSRHRTRTGVIRWTRRASRGTHPPAAIPPDLRQAEAPTLVTRRGGGICG